MPRARDTRKSFTAVVLAAGMGTRMRSGKAKVLHEICGRPLCYFPIAAARAAGARRVVVVVGHQGDAVRARLEALFGEGELDFVVQKEQRGTGHAVRCARKAVEASGAQQVMVLNGDLALCTAATLRKLLAAGKGEQAALLTVRLPDPSGYGRIVRPQGAAGRREISAIVEHQDASKAEREIDEINVGAYLFDRRLLFEGTARLKGWGKKKELYLTDVVALARKEGHRVIGKCVTEVAEVLGVNDRAELAEAEGLLRARINREHLKAGVSFEDPAATYVEVGVKLGRDVHLAAGVHLQGATVIASDCRVGVGSVLRDAVLERGAKVRPYCVVEEARLGPGAGVGPFARVRPGTVLGPKAHLGNFVETKKAIVGAGTKAGHLTYLGDTVIGPGANIGAGTITCNYDGVHKHQTLIGAGVFIGSNTALVAPVSIEQGAYVGAGSTITHDVPAESLGLSRARQRNLEGWVRRKKK
ncbi:MAG: bifunctional UDP-N-acetylglucosamine diphosphorylase/glucosamine-1-phosphate N-acetyltransferase GlmU [Deltaproteobacteria bacterium]|nr:bifunctional UDP-N-acetylglucosamine diphosphorylase/glucosamine-1-phosphate N-acetyltransferase GlmU [Deltaproteobacteria bacterium]